MAHSSRPAHCMLVLVAVGLILAVGASPAQKRPPAKNARPDRSATVASRISPEVQRTFILPRACELQMQEERSIDQTQYYHAPLRTWDWDKSTGKIKYRVLTRSDKTATIVWQVSAAAFDQARTNWPAPTGLLASGTTPRTAATSFIEIDFWLFAPRPANASRPAAKAEPSKDPRRDARGRVAARTAAKVAPQRALRTTSPAPPVPKDVTLTAMAAGTRNLQLTGPTSFFVRAIALDAQGNMIDWPSLPIAVSWGPQPSGDIKFVAPPQPPAAVHPTVTMTEYVPIHWPTNPYKMMCTTNLLGFQKGVVYDFTPRPNSGFEKFIDSWGGLFGFIVQVYGWVAQTYDGLRNGVLDAVASAVGQIDPALGAIARQAASAALTTGMTALGIPPTLPSTDELAGMGKDYLASTLADQVPGLPPEAARAAIDKMASEMKNAYATGGGKSNVFFVPDPADRYRPAILWLEATNRGAVPTTPLDIEVLTGQFTPSVKTVAVVTGVEYKDGFRPMSLYKSRSLPLPSLAPGQTMRIPFAFEETYEEMRDGYNPVQRACWFDGYHNHPIAVSVSTTLANPIKGGPPNTKPQQALKIEADKHFKP